MREYTNPTICVGANATNSLLRAAEYQIQAAFLSIRDSINGTYTTECANEIAYACTRFTTATRNTNKPAKFAKEVRDILQDAMNMMPSANHDAWVMARLADDTLRAVCLTNKE
jgi:hypothetical protein